MFSELSINQDCLESKEYINFFINYLQNHIYVRSKSIIRSYFFLKNPEIRYNKYTDDIIKKLVKKHVNFIRKALKLGLIEFYSRYVYKKTEKKIDPELLFRELIKE